MSKKVLVIGGGPAGIIAAATASKKGNEVILIDKNSIIGKKMLITGNGRCNITNNCDIEGLIENVTRNRNFLYSSFYSFSNKDIIDILQKYDLEIKVENDGRCFPKSDKSIDVINTLKSYLLDNGVVLSLNCNVINVEKYKNKFMVEYIKDNSEKIVESDSLIIATGGKSYPSTGSTGDGYKFGEKFGHNIISIKPSIVPISIKENWIKQNKGLSFKNVKVVLSLDDKVIDYEIGDIIFTHFGISGPAIFNITSRNNRKINAKDRFKLDIDLFPSLNLKELDKKIIELLDANPNKNIINVLSIILKYNFVLAILNLLQINTSLKASNFTKEHRRKLVRLLKSITLNITDLRFIEEAYVTSGGIDIDQINPSTMESKIVEGLFFCGEVLDVDAYTGGFNLQISYSTGYLAGDNQ